MSKVVEDYDTSNDDGSPKKTHGAGVSSRKKTRKPAKQLDSILTSPSKSDKLFAQPPGEQHLCR